MITELHQDAASKVYHGRAPRWKTGYLMRQALFGESAGLPTLIGLRNAVAGKLSEGSTLALAVNRQVADEQRHVRIYRGLLQDPELRCEDTVSPAWTRAVDLLRRNRGSIFLSIISIYVLIEPFNQLAVEQLMMPQLNSNELRQLQDLLGDERRHIDMLDGFEAAFATSVTAEEKRQGQALIRDFLKTFSGGIEFPDGTVANFDEATKWDFLKRLRQTHQRIQAWS